MHVCVCTNATECVLQLQSKGSEGNLFRHRQDGHSGQVGDWIPCIPLTGGGVESQTTSCKKEEEFSSLYILARKKTNSKILFTVNTVHASLYSSLALILIVPHSFHMLSMVWYAITSQRSIDLLHVAQDLLSQQMNQPGNNLRIPPLDGVQRSFR